jgi:hypothetical protein
VTTNTLTAAERVALDEQGYVIFENLIDKGWLQQMRDAF